MNKLFLVSLFLPLFVVARELHFPQNVTLDGELEKRVRLTEKRLKHEPFDLDLIVQDVARDPNLTRRFEEYQGDVSGRTLGSWSYMSRLLGEHPQKLDDIFAAVLTHQNETGYFGNNQQEIGWDYWGRQIFGHGRLLGGLVHYYLLSADERALQAATQLGDYFVQSIPEWTNTHEENPWTNENEWVSWNNQTSNRQHFVKTHMTSILESLMMLHDINPQQAYLDAGFSMLDLFPDFGHYHSHSYMNTMTGMAMLYAKTSDHDVFNRLYNLYWQDIMQHSHTPDGGMREWFPDDHRTEGCSITDWIRLNLYMWSITQDPVYLDEAENAWYNGLNFHQTANGAFGHAICSLTGYKAGYSEAWWCCTMHGLWAYADLVNFVAVADDNNLWFNFYAPMSLEINGARFVIETAYPQDRVIKIKCTSGNGTSVRTHFRVPEWVEQFSATLNGKKLDGTVSTGVFTFDHAWKQNDELLLNLPLTLRIVDGRGNDLLKRRVLAENLYRASFYYGPLLLGIDTQHNNNLPEKILFVADKDYQISGQENAFALPTAHFMIPAVINNFQSTTTLVPISEQTGYQAWTDEWRHFMRNGEKPIEREAVRIVHNVLIKR
mgnify:CR=1 FL=1